MFSLESITGFHGWLNKKTRTRTEMIIVYESSCAYCSGLRDAGLKSGNAKFNDAVYTNMEIQRILIEKYHMNDYALTIQS